MDDERPTSRQDVNAESSLIIRLGQLSDARALAAFAIRMFRTTYEAYNTAADMELYLVSTYGERLQRNELHDPAITTLLAEMDGELVGFAQLRDSAPPPSVTAARPLEVTRFYVDEAWHGRGVARQLMDAVIDTARTRGATTLWLGVWERNPRARAFYRKAGFADVGEQTFLLGTDVQMDVVMMRSLATDAGRAAEVYLRGMHASHPRATGPQRVAYQGKSMAEGEEPTSGDARFVGSVPAMYDRYLGPLLFEDYAADLASRVRVPSGPDAAVLEVAAGTGILTEQLRSSLSPGVALIATDLNLPMLAVAEQRVSRAGLADSVTFCEADATSLPFADGAFENVVCQFGVMFFPDKPRAARETCRVLRPGGQWLFSVWGSWSENSFARYVHEAVASFFSNDPPEFYRVPFGLSDTGVLRALVLEAGFMKPDIVTLDRVVEAPSAMDAATGFVRGNPIIGAIHERGIVDAEEIVEAVAHRLAQTFGDHPLRMPTRVHVVDARRPFS